MPHIHTGAGEFDFTVSGYLVYNDKTLLIKHKKLPIWTPPSGHVEVNQTILDALYAEIWEEAGIERTHVHLIKTQAHSPELVRPEGSYAMPLPFDIEVHPIDDTHSHINLSYVLISDTNNVEPGPGESNTFKWFSIDELRVFSDTNSSIKSASIYAIEYVRKRNTQTLSAKQ